MLLIPIFSAAHGQEKFRIPEISIPKTEKMVDVGGRRLHVCLYGQGGPAVILVSGFGAPQVYWNPVIPELAEQTSVVTYDRAGIGKSEIKDLPTHGVQSAKDLHVLLDKMDVPRPYILIGHSYGGDVVRLFASLFPEDTGGLILEDAQHEDILEEQKKILEGKDLEVLERMTANFSPPTNPKTEGDYRSVTHAQLKKHDRLPDIPFVVLTAGERSRTIPPVFSDEGKKRIIELGFEMQEKVADLIPVGIHIIVEGAGHNIHLEKPDALIGPALRMISQVRNKSFSKPVMVLSQSGKLKRKASGGERAWLLEEESEPRN
jgi:pimeloyl-ACP methyl ester carboxylesterase